jgi:uncharacterized protein (DUF608 family)
MTRKRSLRSDTLCLRGLLLLVFLPVRLYGAETVSETRLFDTEVPSAKWAEFSAQGFYEQVIGVIFRRDHPTTCGVPLGGIDTGCLDIETSGLLGYCTLYNTHVPRRGPLNVPFLGISTGEKTWVLCDPNQTKKPVHWGTYFSGAWPYPEELKQDPSVLTLSGLRTPTEIHYWGHCPVVDMEYETDCPVQAGLRAWAPFLPGDVDDSLIPANVYEVHLRNISVQSQPVTLAFSFPGPLDVEAGTSTFTRRQSKDPFPIMEVSSPKVRYAVSVLSGQEAQFGADLGADAKAWSGIFDSLPMITGKRSGTSVTVKATLNPNEQRVIRFMVTWCASQWSGGGNNWSTRSGMQTHTHRYATRFPDPIKTAVIMAEKHESLLKRILAWQSVVYNEKPLPIWLRDSLVNNLHLITEDGMWAEAVPPIPGWVHPEDGLFGMNECPRGCPQIECIPCSFYGNLPLVYFFPEAALSSLRGYKGYMKPNGDAHWTFGGLGNINFATPNHGFQTTLNGISYTAMVDRYALCHGSEDFDREFYDSVMRNASFTVSLRPFYEIGDAIISMPSGNIYVEGLSAHWFEAAKPGWYGMVPHVGGLHLAQIQIAKRMAHRVGDTGFEQKCAEWLAAGSKSLEEKTWLGTHYLNFWEPESGIRSDLVFGYQLDGEWVSDFHDLGGVFRKERVDTTLDTVRRCNIALSQTGAVNYAQIDSKTAAVEGYGTFSYFPPELLMLAMNYIYEGQKDFGMELARRCWENIVCTCGYGWDMPNIMRGDADTGERSFGNDYYQDMMLWSLPAAMDGEDLAAPCKPGGLVDRMLQAAKSGKASR